MIKLTFCLHRKSGLSLAEFQAYWWEKHAPLVASHKEALRIRKYVQLHSRELDYNDGLRASRAPGGQLDAAPAAYDGVAELWWDSLDDIMATATDPAAITAGQELLEDEQKFIDLACSPLWLGEEKTVFG